MQWQGEFYAIMKQWAAALQQAADQAEAAGDEATAALLRNNPLQAAIDQMPDFETIAANPPGARGITPVGGDLPVPALLPIPGDPAPPPDPTPDPTPDAKNVPPTWSQKDDPIRIGAAATMDLVCELASAPVPEVPLPPPPSPALVLAIAALILFICVILGYVVFVSPNARVYQGVATPPPTDKPTEVVIRPLCSPTDPRCVTQPVNEKPTEVVTQPTCVIPDDNICNSQCEDGGNDPGDCGGQRCGSRCVASGYCGDSAGGWFCNAGTCDSTQCGGGRSGGGNKP
jgi:hypothetical protein